MTEREPAVLVVLIETTSHRWHVAGIGSDGAPFPLFQSEEGNLDEYQGIPLDEQVSFLRHRIAGVLQRGFDRFYAGSKKANQIVLIADGIFPDATEGVTERIAEHFVEWLLNPPVAYLITPSGFDARQPNDFKIVAGVLSDSLIGDLRQTLPEIVKQLDQPNDWELITRPR